MKATDYIAQFLVDQGVRHVFAISGGCSVHMIDSIGRTPGIEYICPLHEQAGAMAADAYARVTGGLGVAISTSGPGATNMVTGCCCAFYDSVPVLFLTGQVSTFRLKGDTGVRQFGFQETDVVSIYNTITKYAVMVSDVKRLRYELEKAVYIARSGRPGPVLVDVPDNLQREDIDPSALEAFVPPEETAANQEFARAVDQCVAMLQKAKRPVLVLGWGVRLSKAENAVLALIRSLQIPVLMTWGVVDLMESDNPLAVGTFGTHGSRHGNYAIQNADLILSIGTKLGTSETGKLSHFARDAQRIVVDIDANELNKFASFGFHVDLPIRSDAGVFCTALLNRCSALPRSAVTQWREQITKWKQQYPICPPEYYKEHEVNPYVFMKELSKALTGGEIIFTDTGCVLAWSAQAMEFKHDQRYFHDFNNTAMGYALPAAMGASLALDKRPIICLSGDGSLHMNIQELATIQHHNLPVKIFVFDNRGHGMVQQTQEQWLDGRYEATSAQGGLPCVDFSEIARAYGFKTVDSKHSEDVTSTISQMLKEDGPMFCTVHVRPDHRIMPQCRFGRPIEDANPRLPRDQFLKDMIVKPHSASLE